MKTTLTLLALAGIGLFAALAEPNSAVAPFAAIYGVVVGLAACVVAVESSR